MSAEETTAERFKKKFTKLMPPFMGSGEPYLVFEGDPVEVVAFIESEKMRVVDSIELKQKPAHGSCCTCPECGWDDDNCMCNAIYHINKWKEQYKPNE